MQRAGFSLVEISIVLVILGLLVGGILAGKTLIRASELRSIGTDLTRLQTTIYSFRDKYFALPGDMNNATSFWGDQATGTNACASAATPDGTPGTCNGDGNGKIQPGTELWRAPQQLAMSGLIEGSYTGTQTGWGSNAKAGTDFPTSKITGTGYTLAQSTQASFEFNYSDITFDYNFITYGRESVTVPYTAALSTEEAWNIDKKMDDDLPGRGKLFASTYSSCPTSSASATATYSITLTGERCMLGLIAI